MPKVVLFFEENNPDSEKAERWQTPSITYDTNNKQSIVEAQKIIKQRFNWLTPPVLCNEPKWNCLDKLVRYIRTSFFR